MSPDSQTETPMAADILAAVEAVFADPANFLTEQAAKIAVANLVLAERQKWSAELQGIVDPKWQPIESAPKDGTVIDIWVVHPDRAYGGCRFADVCWRRDAWRETNGFPIEGLFDAVTDIPLIRASHWMPSPVGPKGGA